MVEIQHTVTFREHKELNEAVVLGYLKPFFFSRKPAFTILSGAVPELSTLCAWWGQRLKEDTNRQKHPDTETEQRGRESEWGGKRGMDYGSRQTFFLDCV